MTSVKLTARAESCSVLLEFELRVATVTVTTTPRDTSSRADAQGESECYCDECHQHGDECGSRAGARAVDGVGVIVDAVVVVMR